MYSIHSILSQEQVNHSCQGLGAIVSGAESRRQSTMSSSLGAAGASISGMRMSGVNNIGKEMQTDRKSTAKGGFHQAAENIEVISSWTSL